jgi:hypothetical protein
MMRAAVFVPMPSAVSVVPGGEKRSREGIDRRELVGDFVFFFGVGFVALAVPFTIGRFVFVMTRGMFAIVPMGIAMIPGGGYGAVIVRFLILVSIAVVRVMFRFRLGNKPNFEGSAANLNS